MRRTLDAESAQTFGKLDAEAIQRVRQQAWPNVESADELHDALLVLGFLTETEGASWQDHFDRLMTDKRATRLLIPPLPCEERGQGSGPLETGPSAPLFRKGDTEGLPLWVAAERLPMFHAVFPELTPEPHIAIPERDARTVWLREDALRELIRGRLEALGPVSTRAVAASLGVETQDAREALYTLEAEGFGMRGHFTSDGYSHSARPEAAEGQPISSDSNGYTADHISLATAGIHATSTNADEDTEWCDRRLLARIHRYTLDRLRQEIEPVSAADFLRFLMRWHHIEPESRLDGPTGLVGVLELLEGFEIPAVAWEQDILPSRLSHYSTTWLDQLCLSGDLVWARLHQPDWSNGRKATPARLAPVALLFRDDLDIALSLSPVGAMLASPSSPSVVGKGTGARSLSGVASQILECLQQRGACFLQDIVRTSRQLPSKVEAGLAELVSHGLITCDGFAGLRSLASPAKHRTAGYRRNDPRHSQLKTLPGRGQWSAISGQQRRPSPGWPNSTAGQTRVGAYGIRPLPPQNLASGRWTILHHPPEDAFDPLPAIRVHRPPALASLRRGFS